MIYFLNFILGTCIRVFSIFILKNFSFISFSYNQVITAIMNERHNKTFIPYDLINSILLIEDKRFREHMGVDFYSIIRALFRIIIRGKIEGASTITQQLVRIITNERELKISRKIKEIFVASLVEKEFTKAEIIKSYILKYNFNKCIGIHKFCMVEGYDLKNLSQNEIFEIVARFKYPSINKKNFSKYLKRVRMIEIILSNYVPDLSNKHQKSNVEQLSALIETN